MKKLTPVMIVEAIEPCLPFWLGLGFEKTVEVPEGDVLGFVILVKDSVEVMYQSRHSIQKDLPALAQMPSSALFYLEVENLDAVAAKLAKSSEVFGRRKTFYGAEEIGHREPAGHVIIFSQPPAH